MNYNLLNYFEDGYNMEKKYSTKQLIKFSEDIYNYWDKTERVISMTDLQDIERELIKREYNI